MKYLLLVTSVCFAVSTQLSAAELAPKRSWPSWRGPGQAGDQQEERGSPILCPKATLR